MFAMLLNCSGTGACVIAGRNLWSWRTWSFLGNIPFYKASSSLPVAGDHWPLLTRASVTLVPSLTHIYLPSHQNRHKAYTKQQEEKNNSTFPLFIDSLIQHGDFRTSSQVVTPAAFMAVQ